VRKQYKGNGFKEISFGAAILVVPILLVLATAVFMAIDMSRAHQITAPAGNLTIAMKRNVSFLWGLHSHYSWEIVPPGESILVRDRSTGWTVPLAKHKIEAVVDYAGLDTQVDSDPLTDEDQARSLLRSGLDRLGLSERSEEVKDVVDNTRSIVANPRRLVIEASVDVEDDHVRRAILKTIERNGTANLGGDWVNIFTLPRVAVRMMAITASSSGQVAVNLLDDFPDNVLSEVRVVKNEVLPAPTETQVVSVTRIGEEISSVRVESFIRWDLFWPNFLLALLLMAITSAWALLSPASFHGVSFGLFLVGMD